MDAKSIQKLQQLKDEMESRKKQKSLTTSHVSGQGFSDESEKFFASVAAKKREDLESQSPQEPSSASSKETTPDHEVDKATLELRREFALLNKICDLHEIASSGKKTLSRKASSAAIKEAKKASGESKTAKPFKQPKKAKSPVRKAIPKRIEKVCWNCKEKFHIYSNWVSPPTLCKACTKYVNEAHISSGPDRFVPTGWIHVVGGGAPGLGKR